MDFKPFAQAITKQLDKMLRLGHLLTVEVNKDEIFDAYLAAFPQGSNPIFRERTEHDCNCCKSFIRKVGGAVAYNKKGELMTIWDIKVSEPAYQAVADAMAAYVRARNIDTKLYVDNCMISQATSIDNYDANITWNHFHYKFPSAYAHNDRARMRGEFRDMKQGIERSVTELNPDNVATIYELCTSGTLYRGDGHKAKLNALLTMQDSYSKAVDKEAWLWAQALKVGHAGNIRSTVIGSLLIDMAKGDDLETAVGKYEARVAPANYKRSKALVTPKMIKAAHDRVAVLGIQDSLMRRFAKTDDLTINNVLHADRSVKESLGAFDVLGTGGKPSSVDPTKATNINIADFVSNVLNKTSSLEAMFDRKHTGNLFSLVAPVNADAPGILKWDNNFSWTYNGEVTDSMAEQVKAHGGKIDGDLRFSIRWNENSQYPRDLDAHCKGPAGHIYYSSRHDSTGGNLDVDIVSPGHKVAVENITWPNVKRMRNGEYKFHINDFSGGGNADWEAEIEFDGKIHSFSGNIPRGTNNVDVATVTLKDGVFSINTTKGGQAAPGIDHWGITTGQFHKVTMSMLSPNFWDDNAVGNKHYFFVMENCVNPDQARGLYNEFLSDALHEDRKVFEHLGAKLKAPHTTDQASGLGFSATKRDTLVVRADGRLYNISF
ncbi:hypothetical protein NVP1152O_075 [Vibrio phage 1.152.O._10N.222.46.E1]|uniref:Coil containing protein n=3 Tax=Nahantvirus 49C7 TaxID=2846601 RepID=A0A2I7RBE2_9CAUD|nr:hypothetical protein NVP1025O_074 [Vibrio phage 1.025.O._10N.222.46.B6]AUR90980.1 hypothetical protein NVP1152O_075 [Vibrio phage 1.152.O._10N.222.46.E1]AUS02448.1 hypothetical protein NVP2130O_074 [Vibrio phage 2.130.O._10N.222.46.C2]